MLEQVTEHVYRVDAGALGLYLIVLPEGLTLIDAGFPGTMDIIAQVLEILRRRADEITDILVTHMHPDHAAGLAEIKRGTGARVWMSSLDAELVRAGEAYRPYAVSPGEHNRAFAEDIISLAPTTFEPVPVDQEIPPDGELPVAGGMKGIASPGHTAGHVVFFWPGDGGVLFLGDVAKNEACLEPSPIYEDFEQGLETLRELGTYDYEVACFAHGAPIVGGAAEVIRRCWP